jgi:hypothetical protein
MSVALEGDEYDNIHDEMMSGDEAVDSLDELYQMGMPRRVADAFLWELTNKNTFTDAEIGELEKDVKVVRGDRYPRDIKDAVSSLLDLLKNNATYKLNMATGSRAKNQAIRNVCESRTGQGAAPGQGPANLIRRFAGVKVPKGSEGDRRSRKEKKSLRKHVSTNI